MEITIRIADVAALDAAGRMALLTLMQIRTDERPADRVARVVAAAPAVPDTRTIADDDRPNVGAPLPIPTLAALKPPPPPAQSPLAALGFGKPDTSGAAPSVQPIPPAAPAASANASASVAVPPAAAPVPSAGADVAPPAPTNALDAQGLPWDQTIHASTKTKNADGTWRQKRGVDPALYEKRVAELRALVAIPAPGTAAPIPPAAGSVPVPALDYPGLMAQCIEWTSAVPPRITLPTIIDLIKPLGLQMLPDLQHRPDLVPQVHALIVGALS